jgi:hypothetical protein
LFSSESFLVLTLFFLAYINCIKGVHCGIFIHAYNIL